MTCPRDFLPGDLGVSVTAAAGYSWFGRQSPALGGFALPDYLNWHAGVTLTYKLLNLDLRYYDTNLTREDCFVFTGDPGATPGGSRQPDHQSRRTSIELVRGYFCRQALGRAG